jgi:hypothetical protein
LLNHSMSMAKKTGSDLVKLAQMAGMDDVED